MIIGVSGKMVTGKDTVYKIIQDLTGGSKSTWENKKFASPIKKQASLLLGVDEEKLENRDFKDKVLSEEWSRWAIATRLGGIISIYADKEEAKTALLRRATTAPQEAKETFLESLKMTPRKLYQSIGKNLRRIHPNIFVNGMFVHYTKTNMQCIAHNRFRNEYPDWVITDVRFPNEVEAIKKRGGIVVRLLRDTEVYSTDESEISLDGYKDFDYIIDNNYDKDNLVNAVKSLLKELKLY